MKIEYISCIDCPAFIIVKPNLKRCHCCKVIERRRLELQANERKKVSQKSARLENAVEARKIKQTTDADTLQDLSYLVHQMADLGDCGPVIHYRPGSPEFQRIADQYKGSA